MEQYKSVKAVAVHGFTFLTPQKWRLFISTKSNIYSSYLRFKQPIRITCKVVSPKPDRCSKFKSRLDPFGRTGIILAIDRKVADNLEGVREIDFWQVGDLPYPLKVRNSFEIHPSLPGRVASSKRHPFGPGASFTRGKDKVRRQISPGELEFVICRLAFVILYLDDRCVVIVAGRLLNDFHRSPSLQLLHFYRQRPSG